MRHKKFGSPKSFLDNIMAGAGSIMDIYGPDESDKYSPLERLCRSVAQQEKAEEVVKIALKLLIEHVASGEEIFYKKGGKTFKLTSVEVEK